MIYRVKMDGQDIYNPQERQYALIEPNLSMELNTSGSFEFTMHSSHPFYGEIRPLTSIIEIYEDEVLIWYGRPVEISTDFYNRKKVYCEGALAFFNDSVQRVHEYNTISVRTFFSTVIANHNEQVDSFKRFTVGNVTVEDKTVYRKLNYKSTFETLRIQCLNAEGGYFFLRRENGVNYIDWLVEMPYDTNQPVEFGLNMLDASTDFDLTSFATCVLPLGEEVDGARLTVASINDGNDIIESEAIAEYGRIVKCVEFPGVTHVDTLYEDGLEYLQSVQFDNMTIECTAAELHWQNENYESFRIGQKVHTHSVPHLIDKYFNLIKMGISLDTAEKKITLGTMRRPTLTEITRDTESSLSDYGDQYQDVTEQIGGIQGTIDEILEPPGIEDFQQDIESIVDDIDEYMQDDGFTDHIQDLLDEVRIDGWLEDHGIDPTELDDWLGDHDISELDDWLTDHDVDPQEFDDWLDDHGIEDDDLQDLLDDPYGDDFYEWLQDHGIGDEDIEDFVPEVVIELIGQDLDEITGGLDDAESYDDLKGIIDELGDYWQDQKGIFDYGDDSGGGSSGYDDIGSSISGTGGEIGAASDPSMLYEIQAQVAGLESTIEGLSSNFDAISASESEVQSRLAELEELVHAIAVDAWVHEVDGERVEVGTVNFVTTV